MPIPQPNKNMDALHPLFRRPVELWLKDVRAYYPGYEIRVTETGRTLERQKYLYSLGRTRPNPDFGMRYVQVTWTLATMHRLKCALDWVPLNRRTGKVLYEARVYDAIYKRFPPAHYGLELLTDRGRIIEYPHLQLKGGQIAAVQAGVKWDNAVGSKGIVT